VGWGEGGGGGTGGRGPLVGGSVGEGIGGIEGKIVCPIEKKKDNI